MGDQPIRRVLVPIAGGSHATFAAELVGIYLEEGEVTSLITGAMG